MIEEQLASIHVSNALLVFQFQENLVISLLFISFFRDDLLLFLNHRVFYDSSSFYTSVTVLVLVCLPMNWDLCE